MNIDGGCFCGAIAYEAEVNPDRVGLCHCTDCQIMSGSAFRTVVATTAEKFRLTKGTLKTFVKTAESGNPRAMKFCGDCGTQMYGCEVGDDPGRISLRVGTINQREQLIPKRQVWRRSELPWLHQLPHIPGIETQDI